jgi:hypothetical protein
MYNLIQIKRRLLGQNVGGGIPTLSGGELAYNENSNELYYGHTNGTVTIAGSGAYLKLDGNQTVNGDKTFLGSTTLSSTTFSPDSLIDIGGNLLTNVAYPSADADAATKKYVDDNYIPVTITGDFVNRSDAQTVSGVKTFFDDTIFSKTIDVTSTVNASAYNVAGTTVIDNSRNGFFANIDASGDLTVTGNLSVLGTQVVVNTETINISGTSTQIDIVNNGTATGITVNQTGSENVAEFYDDSAIALAIVDGGNVGIGTLTPNEKLTVSGNISASGTIYAAGGMEIASGGGATTLYVENGKIGVNTETPNEALTIVGSISASEDIYARNGTLTGTLDVSQGATFASTLSVVGVVDFDSSLDVVGATTLQSTLDVTSAATFASSVSAAGAMTLDNTLYVAQNSTFFANVSGQAGVSTLIDFIIDGGTF